MLDVEYIKSKRKELGLSLKDMALKLGYKSANGFWRIEARLSDPNDSKLEKIADILDVSIERLFNNSNIKNGRQLNGN